MEESSTVTADPVVGFLAGSKGSLAGSKKSEPGSGVSEAKRSSADKSSGKITGTRLTELWLEVKRNREERRKHQEN